MFRQDLKRGAVRDFVFPIGIAGDDLQFKLRGTAFFVGSQGVAITAAHVLDEMKGSKSYGLFAPNEGGWTGIEIIDSEMHPSEDVAVIKLEGSWHSICELDFSSEHSSCEYILWGYPEHVADEIRKTAATAEEAKTASRPDLIYNRGYIRRRISRELPVSIFRGRAFYELSEVAGACCSGAPIINRSKINGGPWQVFGIYIGEETGAPAYRVGYATRCDSIKDWKPKMLETNLSREAATITLHPVNIPLLR